MKPKAFVLMPFEEEFENIYNYLIRAILCLRRAMR